LRKTEKYTGFAARANAEAFLLGFVLIGTQIVLLREFMLVFMGNELVIGLLFALWMFTVGAGAWSGQFLFVKVRPAIVIPVLFLVLIVFPIVTAFSIGFFRTVFFETGRIISLYETLMYSFVLLFPVCFPGGFLFTLLNRSVGETNTGAQKLYAYESLGSLLGGVLVSVVFIYLLGIDSILSLEFMAVISFIFLGILHFRKGEIVRSVVFLFFAIFVLLLVQFVDLGFITRQNLFPNQHLLSTKETPYGSLDLTQTGNQVNVYENGMLIYATGNVMGKEEDVHFAMQQRPDAGKILLLGGGVSGTIPEILKYKSVEKVDYVEANSLLLTLTAGISKIPGQTGIRTIIEDPILYVRNTKNLYDVILINEPPPFSVQSNRLYTFEFYRGLKRILHEGGLISTRLPASENYLSEAELEMESAVFRSLKAVFENVKVVPGKKHYFLASDGNISLNYTKLFSKTKITNQFVNKSYLNDGLLQMRSEALQNDYLEDVKLNHDFKPYVYLLFIKRWLYFYDNRLQLVLLFSVVLLLAFLIFASPNTMAMFTSGFTGASTEIVLLIAFQSMLGYLYLFLGLMITVFMGGLAAGAYLSRFLKTEAEKPKMMVLIQLASALFILLLLFLIYLTKMLSGIFVIQLIYGFMMFFIALFVGVQYGTAFHSGIPADSQMVAVVYPADLLGAGLGSFITVLWIVPVFGIYQSLLILSSLHFITIGLVLIKQKKKISTFKG
jgi:spermidine synthase